LSLHIYLSNPKFLTKGSIFEAYQMGNVVELKVGLHCEECIKMILKAIKKLQDIETYDVDTR
nr:copper transport protein ATX1 [Tanacetum cinerariifolium]